MSRDYIAHLAVGILLGLAAYAVAGALWLVNFAWQNAVAG